MTCEGVTGGSGDYSKYALLAKAEMDYRRTGKIPKGYHLEGKNLVPNKHQGAKSKNIAITREERARQAQDAINKAIEESKSGDRGIQPPSSARGEYRPFFNYKP